MSKKPRVFIRAELLQPAAFAQVMRNLGVGVGRNAKGTWQSGSRRAERPQCPEFESSLTLLSSGVGGRGFFEAETRKTEKENEHETECAQPEVKAQGAFQRKAAFRRTTEERGQKEMIRHREMKIGLIDPVFYLF